MLDANAVVATAQQATQPTGWRVWRERRGYFIRQALFGGLFLVAGVVGAISLVNDPNTVYVLVPYGTGNLPPLDAGGFMAWRVGDFVALVLAVVGGAYFLIRSTIDATTSGQAVVVLLPEGVVFRQRKSTRAFSFASVRKLSATSYRGALYLTFDLADGARARVTLDGRFGRPKPIAQAILGAYRQARVGQQQSAR